MDYDTHRREAACLATADHLVLQGLGTAGQFAASEIPADTAPGEVVDIAQSANLDRMVLAVRHFHRALLMSPVAGLGVM